MRKVMYVSVCDEEGDVCKCVCDVLYLLRKVACCPEEASSKESLCLRLRGCLRRPCSSRAEMSMLLLLSRLLPLRPGLASPSRPGLSCVGEERGERERTGKRDRETERKGGRERERE